MNIAPETERLLAKLEAEMLTPAGIVSFTGDDSKDFGFSKAKFYNARRDEDGFRVWFNATVYVEVVRKPEDEESL